MKREKISQRIGSLLIAILLLLSVFPQMEAEAVNEQGVLYTEGTYEAVAGDTISIPVKIRNNAGMCGYGIVFTYPAEALKPISVNYGSLSQTGMKDNTISSESNGTVSVLWVDSDDVTDDGELFSISFKVLDGAEGDHEINVDYDEQNTFNSAFEDVILKGFVVNVSVKYPEHEHDYGDWVVEQEASCQEEGIEARICSVCSFKDKRHIEKKAHSLEEWVVLEEATCTKDGKKTQSCSSCGNVIYTEIIPAKGHDEKVVSVKAPTCTESGLNKIVCNNCSLELREEIVDALGHTEGEWETEKQSTCTETGKEVKKCTVCKNVISEREIPAKGHRFGNWVITKAATIIEAGEESRQCTVCQAKEKREIPKIVHEEQDHIFNGREDIIKLPACTEEGKKKVYCSVNLCDAYTEVIIPATGHVPGEWEITLEPDCENTGKRQKKCTVCGEIVEEENILAKGHSFSDWIVTTEAGCLTEGEKQRTCTECGYVEIAVIDAKGHTDGTWVISKNATCTETGLKENRCSVCDALLKTEVIDKTEHDLSEWQLVVDATCTEEGSKEAICSMCNEKFTEKIPLKEHKEGQFVVIKEPTCTEAGLKESHCEVCDALIQSVKINFLGHDWDSDEIIKGATCTENGLKRHKCTRCHLEEFSDILAQGHVYGESVVTKEPTFNEAGESVRTCEVCQDRIVAIIPKLSEGHVHDFSGEQEVVKEATCTEKGELHIHCTEKDCDDYKVIETTMANHRFGEWAIVKEPTTSENGEKERVCTVCGKKETQIISKKASDSQGKNETTTNQNNTGKQDSVQTGDDINIMLFIVIFMLSGVIIGGCAFIGVRCKNKV